MASTSFDIGDHVECDLCSKDFTGKTDVGGFIFCGKGVCPECAERFEASCRKYGEEKHIKDRCPPGMPFAQWILKIRGGNNTVTFHTL